MSATLVIVVAHLAETKPPAGAVFHFPDASGVTYVNPDPPGLVRYVEPDIPATLAMGARQSAIGPVAAAASGWPDAHGVPAESLSGCGWWAAGHGLKPSHMPVPGLGAT